MTRPKPILSVAAGLSTAAALLAAGCSHAPTADAMLRIDRPVVLLGEVHDNATQHALRLAALQDALARGLRPALVMEMFDRERQPVIDRLLAASPPADAATLIREAGGPGWDWPLYQPYIELAIANGLPLVAANVSRGDARRVMRDGLQAAGFDPAVPEPMLRTLTGEIEASHCGMLDAATAGRMALAQVARDQAMAAAVSRHAGRGAVLLAGNGHVRNDAGVPHWLDFTTRSRSVSIGLIEAGSSAAAAATAAAARYDRVIVTAAQPRSDPCEAMRSGGPRR